MCIDTIYHPESLSNEEIIKFYFSLIIEYADWRPPTEAELKVIEAKRERQDRVSKLMGEYLLKGYKMLGSTCPLCMVS